MPLLVESSIGGEPVLFISLIFFIECVSYLIYMHGFLANVLLLVIVAAIVKRLARGFYPVFAVYGYDAYPEEIREKAFALHNFIICIAQSISYPIIGFVLAVLLNDTSFYGVRLPNATMATRLELAQPFIFSRVSIAFLKMALALIVYGIGVGLCQPIVVANLFIEIARNPLLGLALYETFAAIPFIVVSPLVLRISRKRGTAMIVLGMSIIALADLLLGFSYRVEIALLAALVASTGYASIDPFFMDVLFSTIPKEYRGTLLGFLASLRTLIGIAMPAIAGFIAEIDSHLPFIVAATVIIISMGLTLSIAKQRYLNVK